VTHRVTLIPGDGVGPEITTAARRVIEAAGVAIEWEVAVAGADVFRRGDSSGVPRETAESIASTGVALKGPLETPVGFGEKSANVTLRKLFETYANVRPARQLPGVPTRYAGEGIDFVVVRENIEDLYAGVEYMPTPDVAVALKIISRKGSEKVIRYAFELARREGRAKVTVATKANILKLTEGLFKRIGEEIAAEYPDVVHEHLIIDNVAHQLVKQPNQFDVLVTTNLAGDIISDEASGLVGGLGFAASGNFGDTVAIFEAVHGSAPKYAGRNVINPTALILSSVMMLRHLGEGEAAQRVEDAVYVTLEQGQAVTQDVARQSGGDIEQAASTTGYTDAVIANLGRKPSADFRRRPVERASIRPTPRPSASDAAVTSDGAAATRLVGLDVYVQADGPAEVLAERLFPLAGPDFRLDTIASRGTLAWPASGARIDPVGWWSCRFTNVADGEAAVDDTRVLALLGRIASQFTWRQVERLAAYGSQEGFTRAQGE
jgi:isocitrate dehydrogenase